MGGMFTCTSLSPHQGRAHQRRREAVPRISVDVVVVAVVVVGFFCLLLWVFWFLGLFSGTVLRFGFAGSACIFCFYDGFCCIYVI
jgi:hypothetical protein